jgi:hypothetical protein
VTHTQTVWLLIEVGVIAVVVLLWFLIAVSRRP